MRTLDTHDATPTFGPHIDAAIARLDGARTAPRSDGPTDARRPVHSVAREGVLAGTCAAAGVAAMFALLDARGGAWLRTPTLLGAGLERLLGLRALADSAAAAVAGYTLAHFAAFVLLATLVAATVRRAQRDAQALGAALLLFAVTELAFCGFVALLAETTDSGAALWLQLALGNVLGWVLLGGWTWRAHPEVIDAFADMVDGVEPRAAQ